MKKLNDFEIAVCRFANDLSLGHLHPEEKCLFDGENLTLDVRQFIRDVEIMEELEYLLRNNLAEIRILEKNNKQNNY